MAATIMAAETSLRLVIRFLHVDMKSQSCWLIRRGGEEIDRLKEQVLTYLQRHVRWAFIAIRNSSDGDEVELLRRRAAVPRSPRMKSEALDKQEICGQVGFRLGAHPRRPDAGITEHQLVLLKHSGGKKALIPALHPCLSNGNQLDPSDAIYDRHRSPNASERARPVEMK